MQLPACHKRGFTLIELMVVVGVLALISGIMIPSFSTYTKNQSLKQAQENFKSDLRSIQNRALTGTGSDKVYNNDPALPALYWAVDYASNGTSYNVYLLASNSCGTNAIESQTVSLPSKISFGSSSGTHCLLFSLEDGSVYEGSAPLSTNPLPIPLVYDSTTNTKYVCVNRTGLIYSVVNNCNE